MKLPSTIVALVLVYLVAWTGISQAQVNYTLDVNTGAAFSRISGGTAFSWNITTANDEEYSTATSIGFNFTYCGTLFTQFQASTNGFIRLGTGLSVAASSDALSGTNRSIVAPLWDNLKVTATSTDITYFLQGVVGSRTLTIEWKNVYWNNTASSPNANFQIVLHETNNQIDFNYGYMGTPLSGSASIGLSDNTVLPAAVLATGKFLSVNVGGTLGTRTYHQSMGYTFNGITSAPDSGTVLTFTPATASPMSGSYSVGTGLTFKTLSQAAMALNINGISGPVVLNIAPGIYDDVFHLVDVAGTSAINTITVQKASVAVTLSPSNGSQSTSAPGTIAGDAMIRLDGTDRVTIDGLSLLQNANNTMSATQFNMGISVNNSVFNSVPLSGAQYNIFKNLTIDLGNSAGLTAGLIGIRFGTTGTTTGAFSQTNSLNSIIDVAITGFHAAGIKMFGHSVANPDSGNIITASLGRNTIGNVIGLIGSDIRTIEMDCQTTVTIENTDIQNISNTVNITNHIYGIVTNLAASASNYNRGIFTIRNNTISGLSNGGSGVTTGAAHGISFNATNNGTVYNIYNNKVYNIFSNCNTSGRASGIQINGAIITNLIARVYNNMVSNIRAPQSTAGPGVRGIDIQNSGGNGTLYVYHNTVLLNDSIPPTSVTHQSACMYIASMGTSSLDLRNNIFINTMSVTGTGRAVGLYASTNANFIRLASTTDYNLYYVGTGSATRGVSTDLTNIFQTLETHRTALISAGLGGPRDVNAKSAQVAFLSSNNLKLDPTALPNYTLVGTPLSSPYNVDIDGETRHASFPYIGADENLAFPLPVELTSFTAVAHGKNVELNWATATETNNYGFEIEKLVNANWNKIGFVEGAGTSSSPKTYAYTDVASAEKTSYRLKQIDRDGKFEYSPTIEVAVSTVADRYELVQNYPNPFNPSTTIHFTVKQTERATVKVYDITGREIAELFNDVAQSGQMYSVQFNGTGLSSGVYFYVLQSAGFKGVKKMQIIK